jgi:hypothetical protein
MAAMTAMTDLPGKRHIVIPAGTSVVRVTRVPA